MLSECETWCTQMIDVGNISFDKRVKGKASEQNLFFGFKGLQESMFGRNLYSCSRLFVAC